MSYEIKSINIRIKKALLNKLDERAEEEGMNRSQYIKYLVLRDIKKNERLKEEGK